MNISDRLKNALVGIVSAITAKYDYTALYPCTVVSQNGDGTLELRPDSATMPGFSRIPIKCGLPGVKVGVNTGARVLLGFENFNPQAPIATVWEPHDLKSLTITATGQINITCQTFTVNGSSPIARQGDIVQGISTPPGTPFIGVIMTGNATALA